MKLPEILYLGNRRRKTHVGYGVFSDGEPTQPIYSAYISINQGLTVYKSA